MRHTQSQSPRVLTQQETDQQMLVWLRERLSNFSEDGYGRRYADTIISRFAELIDNQATFKRTLDTIQDAHKLAMAQVQFAQTVIHQFERQLEQVQLEHQSNGKSAPELELKGK